ncbi:hypothetical protein ABPG74_021881 [Tetrahymena malaccensis]
MDNNYQQPQYRYEAGSQNQQDQQFYQQNQQQYSQNQQYQYDNVPSNENMYYDPQLNQPVNQNQAYPIGSQSSPDSIYFQASINQNRDEVYLSNGLKIVLIIIAVVCLLLFAILFSLG